MVKPWYNKLCHNEIRTVMNCFQIPSVVPSSFQMPWYRYNVIPDITSLSEAPANFVIVSRFCFIPDAILSLFYDRLCAKSSLKSLERYLSTNIEKLASWKNICQQDAIWKLGIYGWPHSNSTHITGENYLSNDTLPQLGKQSPSVNVLTTPQPWKGQSRGAR